MPKTLRGALRLLTLVLAVGLSLPVGMSLVRSDAGRDFPRCIHACNDTRQACYDRCTVDCTALYPNNLGQRNACIGACKNICEAQSDDCKLVCGQTPPCDSPPCSSEP
jgi:hypothetical protein